LKQCCSGTKKPNSGVVTNVKRESSKLSDDLLNKQLKDSVQMTSCLIFSVIKADYHFFIRQKEIVILGVSEPGWKFLS